MKPLRFLLAITVMLVALTSCNSHNDDPDLYINVPIRVYWPTEFVSFDWSTASPTDKAVLRELTTKAHVFNSSEEFTSFNEYSLFPQPLNSMVVDFSNSTVVVTYLILGGIPDTTTYNMYYTIPSIASGAGREYSLVSNYVFSANSQMADDDSFIVVRNAVIVDKIPDNATVKAAYGESTSAVWD